MTPLLKKLNFKGQAEIFVLNPPNEFAEELSAMAQHTSIKSQISASEQASFVLVFVTSEAEVEAQCQYLRPLLLPNAVWWFAYPKGSSKRYSCAIHRDNGWASLEADGFESVRIVAIDNDWSALRFKHVIF